MRKSSSFLIWFIFLFVLIALVMDFPSFFKLPEEWNFSLGPFRFKRNLTIRRGLDLQGGAHLVLETAMEAIAPEDREQALESAKNIISRRIDLYGVTEPVIQTAKTEDKSRIIVELPGVKNINEAIDLIGKTAQLDFRELAEEKKASPSADSGQSPSATQIFDFLPTDLTGKDLKKAQVQFDQRSGEPIVSLQFNTEGADKFAAITQRNVGYPVAIFLDGLPLTLPRVNEPILNGQAMISGQFDLKEAKNLAIQLNAGALPVPIKIVEQKTIGATLGDDSVKKSIIAGLAGLVLVVLFMFVSYGFLGFLADIGLLIYGLLTLALYKLIPVTLTLPGIAGFLLSVGMAVDANILIFERMKEEKWLGKPLPVAMELGFGRAWDSIKDANICTLITCFILFNPFNWGFLNTSGMVRGFALTLSLGIGISLFTGIVVTRTLIRVFYKKKI
jgi:preprotein translocase subunit SecD